ncbi:hypothetical protein D3C76_1151610 [compost metagenome]
MLRDHARIWLIRRFTEPGKPDLVLGEDQLMAISAMLVVPGNAFFRTQALHKLKITFTILRAIFAFRAVADIESKGIGQNAMALKHFSYDLRHRQVLENPLVVAELQVMQRRHEDQLIAGQAFAGFADKHILDTPMNTFAVQPELDKGRLAEQAFQIKV